MTFASRAAALAIASLVLTGTAFAQTPAAAPADKAAPAATTNMAKPKAAMTPESQKCSDEADAKGLHGKERKKFREKCKKGK
jgi:hypothetical protein